MPNEQVPSPVAPGTSATDGATGEGAGSALTAKASAAQGATPSASGAASEAPPAWMAQLEGDLKGDKSLTRYRTVSELGKAHRELERKLSAAVVLPGKDAAKEEWDKVWKALGRPENSKDYKLESAENEEAAAEFRELSLKHGLTQDQAQAIFAHYQAKGVRIVREKTEDVRKALREPSRWGSNYDEEMGYAERGFKWWTGGDPDIERVFNRTGLGNSIPIILRFNRLGRAIGEASAPRGEPTATPAKSGVPFGRRTEAQLADVIYKKGT